MTLLASSDDEDDAGSLPLREPKVGGAGFAKEEEEGGVWPVLVLEAGTASGFQALEDDDERRARK